jgi:predicted MFS family arabinose efflux permease
VSPAIIGLGILGVILTILFALVERNALEPILPLQLFAIRTFSLANFVGFLVGFAMYGSITYLPVFFQIVWGESPTHSGLQLLPVVLAVFVTSIAGGQFISRSGRYRALPITGTALVTLSLLLLSTMGPHTSRLLGDVYLAVLGIGLGLVMQVVILIVQNTVPYSDLGVATSSANFFRLIGGSFGAAIFGAIFSNVLVGNLRTQLHGAPLPVRHGGASSITPALLDTLPSAVHHAIALAYSNSISTVFLIAAPVSLIGFFATLRIPHLEISRGRGAPTRTAPVPTDVVSAESAGGLR